MGDIIPRCGCNSYALDQALTVVMRMAIGWTNITLTKDDEQEVNNLVANKKDKQIKLTNCTV